MIDLSSDVRAALRKRRTGQRLKQGGFVINPFAVVASSGDPYWSDVLLYSRFNGTAGSTTFTDLSPVGRTLTAQGGAVVASSPALFNESADLQTTKYIDAGTATDVAFGSSNFAIELAFNFSGIPSSGTINTLLNKSTAGNHGWELLIENVAGTLRMYFGWSTNGTTLTYQYATVSLSVTTWYRFALVRSGSTLYFFLDGTRLATAPISGTIWPSTAPLRLAGTSFAGQGIANGYMDELRITKNDRGMTGASYTLATTEFPTS